VATAAEADAAIARMIKQKIDFFGAILSGCLTLTCHCRLGKFVLDDKFKINEIIFSRIHCFHHTSIVLQKNG